MIDVHCHILPGIDDGAKTMEEALIILRKAEKAGISDIVLTPHYMIGTIYNADNVKKWGLYQELKKKAKEAGINVNLYLGNEIYIDGRLPQMLGGYIGKSGENIYDLATLNSRKYVLVEFPVQNEDKSAAATLFSLVQDGFIPVIAHPERYHYVQDDPSLVDQYLQMGCKLQGDYLALTGKYGKRAEKTLRKLLAEDKIFCLASDIHKGTESYHLDSITKKLTKLLKSEQKVKDLLHDNPAKMIA